MLAWLLTWSLGFALVAQVVDPPHAVPYQTNGVLASIDFDADSRPDSEYLLGTSDKVHAMQGQPDYNEYSVRLELQADYFAGVWANHNQQYLDMGDIEEAMQAANAVGDDTIQNRTQGRVVPHSFTHGTAEQRMRWFNKGLESGSLEGGDTFSIPYKDL